MADRAVYSVNIMNAAWAVAARHLCRGQRDPVEMIAEAIEAERRRCVALINASGIAPWSISPFIEHPDADW